MGDEAVELPQLSRNCSTASWGTFAVEHVFIAKEEKEADRNNVPFTDLIFIHTLDLMLLTETLKASCIKVHCWD